MIERKECVLCGGNLLFVQVFKNFPVYMGVTDKNEQQLTSDMEFCSCDKCGCVQLKNLIDPSVLYIRPHNPAIGKTWESHNESLSRYLISTGAKNILDIGGANMRLADKVCQSDTVNTYTVCDMSVGSYEIQSNKKIKTIRERIENLTTDDKYDAVVLSHTLEHFYTPVDVLKNIARLLKDDAVVVISVPNIEQQLIDGFLNAMNFEHTYYISHEYMNLLADKSGFKINNRVDFSKYNSFYTLQKNKQSANTIIISDVSRSRVIYENHVKSVIKDVAKINYAIEGKRVYCFGAHIFTQMLIACGLNTNCIRGILDNDINKVGKCLYGTNISVFDSSVISEHQYPTIIVRAAQYEKEIIDCLIYHNDRSKII